MLIECYHIYSYCYKYTYVKYIKCNKCELCIHFLKINKNNYNSYFLTCSFQFTVMGEQTLSWKLRAQVGDQPWTGHHSMAGCLYTHTYPHSYWDNLDIPTNVTCTSLECERQPEHPENSHRPGTICKSRQTVAPAGNSYFPSSML